jgi:two-component system response regulator ChvI
MSESPFILILDNEKDIVTETAAFLRGQGLNIHAFTDPLAALEDFKQNFSDCYLILSAIRMQHMNGFQFVRNIRQLKPDLKVVFMTTFEISTSEFQMIHPSMKVYSVIKKPILMRKLAFLIKNSMAMTSTMIKYEEKAKQVFTGRRDDPMIADAAVRQQKRDMRTVELSEATLGGVK